ncbi:rod shape-determining protein MreD [Clostridium sp. P21]|uniref:Rod shape-determining protein MreD n=1 Tax=Clostridium muellerianum TaxID=2716538 RepID=A0A7Y0EJC0_9CLOT|nr:rod shape-determining protein MreD [Clostridium muellerianum]NMM64534.1 rod shape-determining protein MreD [Clostridium muellerianum]
MKKILVLFLLSILFFMLDNVVMPFLAIKTIYPSLLLVFCICYSIVNGKWEGLWLGVFCGMLQDVYFINAFGINTLLNMIMCLIAGVIGENIFKKKSMIPIGSCFLLSLLKGLIVFLTLYLNKIYTGVSDVLFISLYNMVVSIIMYKKIYRLCGKEYMQRRWRF